VKPSTAIRIWGQRQHGRHAQKTINEARMSMLASRIARSKKILKDPDRHSIQRVIAAKRVIVLAEKELRELS